MVVQQFLVLDDAHVRDPGWAQNLMRRFRAGAAKQGRRTAGPGVGALDVPLGQQPDGQSEEENEQDHDRLDGRFDDLFSVAMVLMVFIPEVGRLQWAVVSKT